MTPAGLTQREAEALAFIRQYKVEHTCAPTLAEIAKATGLAPTSKSRAHDIIQALRAKGYVQTFIGRTRSIVLTAAGEAVAPDPYSAAALRVLSGIKLSDLIVAAGAILAQRRKGRAA